MTQRIHIFQVKFTSTHRDRELKELTKEQVIDWAKKEVNKAFDREGERALHASRLDDVLENMFVRLKAIQLLDMPVSTRKKLRNCISYHKALRIEASEVKKTRCD